MLKFVFNFRTRGVCDLFFVAGLPDQMVTAGYCIIIVQYYCPVYRKAMYWYFRWRTWRLENGLIYQHCFEYLHWWKGRIHILIGLKRGMVGFFIQFVSFSLFHSVCIAYICEKKRKKKCFIVGKRFLLALWCWLNPKNCTVYCIDKNLYCTCCAQRCV